MPEPRRPMRRRALLGAVMLAPLLAACGRKGNLELPEGSERPAPAAKPGKESAS
ncbi:LPS translocon maturation chaperone LptM [Marinimicrococcus flavescens]|uniref:Lipoprotein n=1 Tax=Marinimicrococcus flavescens TaxID=3031815 RepID=A0AAP3XSZ7_9PROT|nr:lipoprotein [Marinimicrococcus flavescens]